MLKNVLKNYKKVSLYTVHSRTHYGIRYGTLWNMQNE